MVWKRRTHLEWTVRDGEAAQFVDDPEQDGDEIAEVQRERVQR